MSKPNYPFFGVTGIEIEYGVVDSEMRPACLVEPAFRQMTGRSTSDVTLRRAVYSNELAAHVFELKLDRPSADLAAAEEALFDGMSRFQKVLAKHFNASLLPGGMHPLMKPGDTQLWRLSGRRIYETYARIFDIRQHGWLNVQSMHINLPFGESQEQTAAMHNAMAIVMPYLPALTASSPIYEGRFGAAVDNRLAFYKTNQKPMPEIAGPLVPEYMTTYAAYKREIFKPIYARLRRVKDGPMLCHEWVNSRGAIVRFMRNAIELRILDSQECVKMDVAVAVFAKGVIKALTTEILSGNVELPRHSILEQDFLRTVRHGTRAEVKAPHFRRSGDTGTISPSQVLIDLLPLANVHTPPREKPYLSLVERRLRAGNLSELITKEVKGCSLTTQRADRLRAIRQVYAQLQRSLQDNTPWHMG